ncbi:MAG TPA: ArsC family (seleno)protein [Planctomycetota bacterium]|nr:ArsC family (seleno)protein [Planctomycetota bacterium]
MTVGTTVDARKRKMGRDEAVALARTAKRIVVAEGRGVRELAVTAKSPSDDALADALLGRSGTLRAPTLRIGDVLLVGFSEAAYAKAFGPAR